MKTTTIAALLALSAGARALAFSSSATALELDNSNSASASAEAAKSDIGYVLAGGYAHFFATDFDAGGGDVAVDRVFGSFSMRGSESDSYRWDLGFQWEGAWYDFRNGGSLAAAAGGRSTRSGRREAA